MTRPRLYRYRFAEAAPLEEVELTLALALVGVECLFGAARARLEVGHLFDPEKTHLITAANQQSKTDYNLYEGTEVVGDVETVLLRGQVIVDGGEVVGKPGVGRFVKRARFGEQLAATGAEAPAAA